MRVWLPEGENAAATLIELSAAARTAGVIRKVQLAGAAHHLGFVKKFHISHRERSAAISIVEAGGDCFIPAVAGSRNDVTGFFNRPFTAGFYSFNTEILF